MAASTTHSNHMPGLRLRYGRGVGRGRISTGYSGYHPTGGRPPDAPRLAMWSPPPRHVAIWVSNDPQRCRGHSWCSISGGSRSHGVLSSKKPSYPVFFSYEAFSRSYNRGPGFESPKSIRNDESEGSGGQNFPLRDLPLTLRALTVVAPRVPAAAASMALDLRGVHREGARRRRRLPFCAPEGWIGR